MYLPKGQELVEHMEAAKQHGCDAEHCADCGRDSDKVELTKINEFEFLCEDCFAA